MKLQVCKIVVVRGQMVGHCEKKDVAFWEKTARLIVRSENSHVIDHLGHFLYYFKTLLKFCHSAIWDTETINM